MIRRTEATPSAGLLPGFGELLRKELLEARRSKRIIIFLVMMTGALLLIPLIGYLHSPYVGDGMRHIVSDDDMDGIVIAWAGVVGVLGSLMVIASTVDAMTRERSLGISAWILTKPVSRLSYLLAKAGAHALISIVTLIVVPTIVWLAVTTLLFENVPLGGVIFASMILFVEMIVLSFITISLGVPFRSVAPITVLVLALWFAPTITPGIAGLHWTLYVLPTYLPLAAASASISEGKSFTFSIPLFSLAIAAGLFLGAVVMFERQEL